MRIEAMNGRGSHFTEGRNHLDQVYLWTEDRRNAGWELGRRNIAEIEWYDRWE